MRCPRTALGGSLASMLLLSGCFLFGPNPFLSERETDIKQATEAVAKAPDDVQRAKAYSARGVALSEKARFSRIMKLIPTEEYIRTFDASIQDHNHAVALDPKSADVYFNRAQANYDRGSLDLLDQKDGKAWFAAAASDFEKATELAPRNALAFDRLGLTYESSNQDEKAIEAYTKEMALDSLGKSRLANAYCSIGFRNQQEKQFAAAAVAYEKSTQFGKSDEKTCPNDPYTSIVWIYTTETREYDKAWDAVHRAEKEFRVISPELIERLKKDSGRSS